MLTTEAFNALLKTIEEPPAHVVFIFCTTEPQKVPATIVSRCFHISLTRASDEELIHSLRRIVAEEKIDVDDDALSLIAHLGDGGFRDTQKLFEEVVALSKGQKITKALVEEKTQTSNLTIFITTLLASLSEKDVKKSLEVVGQLVEAGIDIKYFLQEFLQALHRVLLQKAGVVSEDSIVAGFSIDEIQTLVTLFQNAYRDTKFAVIPQLPLEIALVKWCTEKGTDVGNESSSKGKGSSSTDFAQDDKKSLKVSLNDVAKKEKNLKVQAIIKGTTSSTSSEKTEPKEEGSTYKQEDLPKDASGNALFMENIIYKVKPYNHSVAGVLRGCNIKLMDGEKIVFETPYKFHKERLEEVKTREILEKGVKEITGKNLLVMVELKQ
jgi:DNA polymerase-3 subunit gamma/tau